MRVVVAIVLMAVCQPSALAQFPAGYHKDVDVVVKEHWRIYGVAFWRSIVLAQIEQESGWRRCPRSAVGAVGLTQFMPSTQRAVESKYGIRGSACDPAHAARLQAYLMRDNAVSCGERFEAFLDVWSCSLRTYNGSPRNFWREWEAADRPAEPFTQEVYCERFRAVAHCRENTEYWRRIILERWWPRYYAAWGGR